VRRTFGEAVLVDRRERAMRVLEEASELAQAAGVAPAEAAAIAARVWSRPPGDADQEAAGVLFCVLMWCEASGLDIGLAMSRELSRVEAPGAAEACRAKHGQKVAAGIGLPLSKS
jgi:hypothetical protein